MDTYRVTRVPTGYVILEGYKHVANCYDEDSLRSYLRDYGLTEAEVKEAIDNAYEWRGAESVRLSDDLPAFGKDWK